MANEEQLSILKQGVEVWNEWRNKNPETEIVLDQADLRGANLREVNLWEAYLEKANLSRANLRQVQPLQKPIGLDDITSEIVWFLLCLKRKVDQVDILGQYYKTMTV